MTSNNSSNPNTISKETIKDMQAKSTGLDP